MKTVYVLGGMLAGAAWLGAQPVAAAIFNGTLGLKADPAQVTASRHKAVKVASPAIKPTTVVQGLNRPWSLAFLPQGGYLVTERGGQLNYAPDFATKPVRVGGMPKDIEVSGQSGLFEIALAPDFETSREVFVSYGAETAKGNVMKVVRAVLDVRAAKPALQDVKVVFTSVDPVKDDKNLGGKLMFVADGTLLVTVGDFFEQDESQNLGNHLGKVIRINRDGSVPTNNPMVGRAGVRPEIYSYGNRNVQGIAVRPGTRDVWMHEHGPKGGDEVNILKAGTNYGWPLATFGVDYSGLTITSRTTVSGTVDPLVHWTPSIAPSGLAFYTGTAVPQWRNDAFVGALAGKQLRRLDLEEGKVVGEEVLLKDMDARIRDVRMGPDGHLYVVTDERDGKIVRLDTL